MASIRISELARAKIAAEQETARLETLKKEQAALAVTLERKRREEEARIRSAAERERALLEAMRLEAEATARAAEAAEQAALEEEMARLRARTPLEVLQEEVIELKKQLATRPPDSLHLRADGELDMRFKSSREEVASARAEITELKEQMATLMNGRFIISNVMNGNVLDNEGGLHLDRIKIGHDGRPVAGAQVWSLQRV